MASASTQHNADTHDHTFMINRPVPEARDPVTLDYILFFLCIPMACAFLFSLVGTRLTTGMPYLDSFLYLNVHMFIAWWEVGFCAYMVKLMFRSWQPPVIAVCVLGYFLSIIPAAFTYQAVGEYFATLYPTFAANRADDAMPNWGTDYLFHFIRYSIPALPLFLGGVYGYRYITGVDWYGYPSGTTNESAPTDSTPSLGNATAALIEGSKLPDDALIMAIKAEQHYIQIWSDKGSDLVRFRFRDIPVLLAGFNGEQVHRSWWVNLDFVKDHAKDGRKLNLILSDSLTVPVSLSYKNVVLRAIDSH